MVASYPWIPDMVKAVSALWAGYRPRLNSRFPPAGLGRPASACAAPRPGSLTGPPPAVASLPTHVIPLALPTLPQIQVSREIYLPPIFFTSGIGLTAIDVQRGYTRMAELAGLKDTSR